MYPSERYPYRWCVWNFQKQWFQSRWLSYHVLGCSSIKHTQVFTKNCLTIMAPCKVYTTSKNLTFAVCLWSVNLSLCEFLISHRNASQLSSPDIWLASIYWATWWCSGSPSLQTIFQTGCTDGQSGFPSCNGALTDTETKWWFSAHLHVRFEATVQHEQSCTGSKSPSTTLPPQNPDEIAIADDHFDAIEPQNPPTEVPRLKTASHNPD